ncbi:hypothetical protein BN2497_12533 [Janthinobacterium sp. CG23_2]|nr:hypothetical protein BN2497_12533 [Janthinobacterium sp. CG23_2]CUU32664.1 hypothetical protein BN3177_12533 [Janthinobacterium sp. CG23_2]
MRRSPADYCLSSKAPGRGAEAGQDTSRILCRGDEGVSRGRRGL